MHLYPSYSGGWDRRIGWTQEFIASLSNTVSLHFEEVGEKEEEEDGEKEEEKKEEAEASGMFLVT